MSPSAAPTPRTLRESVQGLRPYLDGVLWRWVCGLLAALLSGLAALAIPQVIQVLVNNVFSADGSGGRSSVVWAGVVLLVLGLAEALFVWLRRVFILPPASDVENRARIGLYRRLQRLPVAFHDAWPSGQLLSRAQADLGLVRRWIAFGSVMFVVDSLVIVVGVALLFTLSWQLALLYLVAAVPIIIRSFSFRNDFRTVSRLSQDQAGDLATTVEESVHGIRILKAFGRGTTALEGFRTQASTLQDTEVRKAGLLASFVAMVVALPEVVLGVGLAWGVYLVATGQMMVGALAAFFATTAVLARPVESVGQLLGMTLSAKTAIDRHLDVISVRPAITSPAGTDPEEAASLGATRLDGDADEMAPPSGALPVLPPSAGGLAFRDVEFRYPDAAEGTAPLLRGVDLELIPGETMALVGTTGSGKSTLLQLVPRLYEATSGRVEVDGADVRDFPLEELRRRVAVAFEEPTLFSDTVRNNVLLGAPVDVLADEEKAQQLLDMALDTAQAGFARALPDGLDTEIGEEGLSLSGGQRQRLALARAIAAQPKVLVLDDPLSALDVRTEEAVTQRLREVLADTTTLVVSHRPSTVALADRVAVMADGRIVDVGTHLELLARSAAYRDIISNAEAEEARA